MSSRQLEKKRRRAEREQHALEAEQLERRRQRRWLAVAGAVAVLGVSVVVAAVASSGDGDAPPEASEAAFGQHYEGLQERREAAGVSTMGRPTSSEHTHQKLRVSVNGERVPVPANIGIEPGLPGEAMASLHTHTPDGTLHNEGQADSTLGQFFAVWGVPFGPDRLGPYRAGDGKKVQMWVNGEPSTEWRALRLTDGQEITVAFGRPRDDPPAE